MPIMQTIVVLEFCCAFLTHMALLQRAAAIKTMQLFGWRSSVLLYCCWRAACEGSKAKHGVPGADQASSHGTG